MNVVSLTPKQLLEIKNIYQFIFIYLFIFSDNFLVLQNRGSNVLPQGLNTALKSVGLDQSQLKTNNCNK